MSMSSQTTVAAVDSAPSYTGYPALDQLLAGVGAGMISTICMQPLDLLKTRLQLDNTNRKLIQTDKTWGKTYRCLKMIVVNEGGFWALYKGMSPNIVGNAASWGLYFMWYSMIKTEINRSRHDPQGKLTALQYLSASAIASAITVVWTNPIWLVKTRMMGSRGKMSIPSSGPAYEYQGLWSALVTIYREEGILGLYRGMVPALFGVSHGALQWMAYEKLKSWRLQVHGNQPTSQDQLSTFEYVAMSSSSKLFATIITYPYQVVRSRIQFVGSTSALQPYSSLRDVIIKTYTSEGLYGFYKGLSVNAVRVLPGTIITFLCYENLSNWFTRHGT